MANHKLLRLSAILLFIGLVFSDVLQYLHPGGGPTYEDTFANYAASGEWAAINLGQFVGEVILLAGLLVLFFALNLSEGTPHWLGLFGAISAGVALALAGVLDAVDGVALKQAVDAWTSASAAEQSARFTSAEAIRWLEWGTNSYWNLMQGLALVLFAIAIVWTARVPQGNRLPDGIVGSRLHRSKLVSRNRGLHFCRYSAELCWLYLSLCVDDLVAHRHLAKAGGS